MPRRPAGHRSDCSCLPCWAANEAAARRIVPRPHAPPCRCAHCWAWLSLTRKQWQRRNRPPSPSPAVAVDDPTLRLLERLNRALASGLISVEEHQQLGVRFFDGDLDAVTRALDALT